MRHFTFFSLYQDLKTQCVYFTCIIFEFELATLQESNGHTRLQLKLRRLKCFLSKDHVKRKPTFKVRI